MLKSLIIILLLSLTNVLKSQVTVKGAKKLLKKFEHSTLNIVGADAISQKMYLKVIKNELPFEKIVFIDDNNFMSHLKLNEYYLVNLKVKVSSDYGYTGAFSSLSVFKATQRIINIIDKNKDLSYTSLRSCIESPIEAKKFESIQRYNFGVFKNMLQQVKDACEKGKDGVFSKDYANKKLSLLKHDTLFIVQDNPERNYLPDLFRNHYSYAYKFISNTDLEDFVLDSNKDFYYLHFDYSQMRGTNQISIVNSLTGNQIFHDQSHTPDLLSERMLKMIVEKIDR